MALSHIVTAPEPLPAVHDKPRVFLGGSIDMGEAPHWQRDLIRELGDQDVVILNPRRADWDAESEPVADDTRFRQQVEWELSALESADVILLYLSPGSQSPISLLELGLYTLSGKLIVHCPEGFWRKGNVDLVCQRYGVELVEDVTRLVSSVRRRVDAAATRMAKR